MATTPTPNPLKPELWSVIPPEGLAFLGAQTGISDPEELRKHALSVQEEAYSVHPYRCIRRFAFLQLKLARLPAYGKLLAIGKERKNPIFLDIGCCFGNDIHKAVADGFPMGGVIGSDLHPEYWDLGHKLFKTTPETFPVAFLPGDVFDPVHLEVAPPAPTDAAASDAAPPFSLPLWTAGLTSLNPLRARAAAIHASSFFHLFDEAQQLHVARALAGLLDPAPGSVILGSHGGRAEKGLRTEVRRANSHGRTMFCHSPESWAALWDGEVFPKGVVRVEAMLEEVVREDAASRTKSWLLVWSVTRV
ncbi:uncharacterized protein BXZ73DRAFT_102633 [Epithele typhae]|uniref:uncharacterized protein n=1 Tax=Epithele typhae TaxID=378194 RepID=UPI002008B4FD|nr:uncharacterized protein BXZ73DRAFT_102633 [Epithele typhae]KAH9927501.1 hypothetical protein BXZ73DRAFT_102633 [Epithele typhae]